MTKELQAKRKLNKRAFDLYVEKDENNLSIKNLNVAEEIINIK